ncbi:hypothetical protein QD357_19465 [Rhizobium sp. BR 317]|uniref:hypothetical protein n=1 Tax=Rhizobium sp. BR 317 TaxID=3040015 RepID=UPI0039BFEC3C
MEFEPFVELDIFNPETDMIYVPQSLLAALEITKAYPWDRRIARQRNPFPDMWD